MKIQIVIAADSKSEVLTRARKRLGQMTKRLQLLGKQYMHYASIPEKWVQEKLHRKIEAFMATRKAKKEEIAAQRKKIAAQQDRVARLSAPPKRELSTTSK